jgi:hypothetical protein
LQGKGSKARAKPKRYAKHGFSTMALLKIAPIKITLLAKTFRVGTVLLFMHGGWHFALFVYHDRM